MKILQCTVCKYFFHNLFFLHSSLFYFLLISNFIFIVGIILQNFVKIVNIKFKTQIKLITIIIINIKITSVKILIALQTRKDFQYSFNWLILRLLLLHLILISLLQLPLPIRFLMRKIKRIQNLLEISRIINIRININRLFLLHPQEIVTKLPPHAQEQQ